MDAGVSISTNINPDFVGNPTLCTALFDQLVQQFGHYSVPRSMERLRMARTTRHSSEMMDQFVLDLTKYGSIQDSLRQSLASLRVFMELFFCSLNLDLVVGPLSECANLLMIVPWVAVLFAYILDMVVTFICGELTTEVKSVITQTANLSQKAFLKTTLFSKTKKYQSRTSREDHSTVL